MTTRAISALVFMLAVASGMAAQCAEIVGRIVKVADGDTLTILTPATGTTGVPPVAQHKIRLHGIDAPEPQGDAASCRVVWTHREICGARLRGGLHFCRDCALVCEDIRRASTPALHPRSFAPPEYEQVMRLVHSNGQDARCPSRRGE